MTVVTKAKTVSPGVKLIHVSMKVRRSGHAQIEEHASDGQARVGGGHLNHSLMVSLTWGGLFSLITPTF